MHVNNDFFHLRIEWWALKRWLCQPHALTHNLHSEKLQPPFYHSAVWIQAFWQGIARGLRLVFFFLTESWSFLVFNLLLKRSREYGALLFSDMNIQLHFYIYDMDDVCTDSSTHSGIHLKSICTWITKWSWLWLCRCSYGALVPRCSSAQHWWKPHQPQFVCLRWGRPGNDPWSVEAAAWLSAEVRANRGHLRVKARKINVSKQADFTSNHNFNPFLNNWWWQGEHKHPFP